jgi:hypothetical protein
MKTLLLLLLIPIICSCEERPSAEAPSNHIPFTDGEIYADMDAPIVTLICSAKEVLYATNSSGKKAISFILFDNVLRNEDRAELEAYLFKIWEQDE